MFNVGDTVVKAGFGIGKIKSVQSLFVDGKEQQLYVLQSGDAKVMVPFAKAHSGGLRHAFTAEDVQKMEDYLREPIPLPEGKRETYELYEIDIEQAKECIKRRDAYKTADVLKTLFYRSKLVELTQTEDGIYKDALKALAEEIAYLEHITRLKVGNRLKAVLGEGRQVRKDSKINQNPM